MTVETDETTDARGVHRRTLLGSAAGGVGAIMLGGAAPALGRSDLAQANLRVVRRYYAAYGRGDRDVLRREIFASDIRWTIPGHHPLAGTKRGVDETIAFFDQLARAGFRAQTFFLEANDRWVVDLHRGYSTRGRPRIDIHWALAMRVRGGRIVEAVNYPGDQHQADRFFNAFYQLRPIPHRLAGD